MKLAVIPARGGSKRIPRKNIKIFHGKPMIAWSIEAAIKSNCFDRIIVSTDDEEIAAISKEYGAEIPFIRPIELSDDHTDTISVVAHAIEALETQGYIGTEVCCIYATAPFIDKDDIRKGLSQLVLPLIDYAISVTSYAFPIQRAIRINKRGTLSMVNSEKFYCRSQDLEEVFHDAGQFYWGKSNAWKKRKPVFGENTIPIILPRKRVQDIDTYEDWENAELIFRAYERK